ncbi:hypothetical protein DRP04_05570 [Archaeoglobales archaeon]|nr:MAG: hypothetical protein DRP04_05570 [Archaeoglobales archaeon]
MEIIEVRGVSMGRTKRFRSVIREKERITISELYELVKLKLYPRWNSVSPESFAPCAGCVCACAGCVCDTDICIAKLRCFYG